VLRARLQVDDASDAPHYVAESGSVQPMAWLTQQQDVELYEYLMISSAVQGHTELCQYLRLQQHCPWICATADNAASGGHIGVLCMLICIDSGCPWEVDLLCMAAARGGSVEMLQQLQHPGFLTSTALHHMNA
jgi:hypothetical protein